MIHAEWILTKDDESPGSRSGCSKLRMRKARRCVWVLVTFAMLCAVYFLLVIHGEHGTWAELDSRTHIRQALAVTDNSTGNASENNQKCPADPEFVALINGTAYGHPVYEKDKRCVYVSVPKCGSRTFVWIAWALHEKNNITAIASTPYLLMDKSENEMRPVISEKLASVPPGSLVHGHLRFMKFADPNPMPVYISMLRDPLSRHISWYYFMRYGDADMDAKKLHGFISEGPDTINETYDECVQKNRPSCASPYYTNMNIRTFCGYEEKCVKSPEYALEQAKRNVDRFLFVGIVEEYEDTLLVMEHLLPSMFSGAVKEYHKNKDQFSSASKTAFKKEPQPGTIDIMRTRMKLDYEFYHYVRERFHKLKRHLGIGSCK